MISAPRLVAGLIISLVALLASVGGRPALADGEKDVSPSSAQELSPTAAHGRSIYHHGVDPARGPIRLALSSSDLELDAAFFPCAHCHGADGLGSREGGIEPPPVRWRDLTGPARSPLTDRERPGHDRDSLERAITAGIDPSGAALHPGMPRYRLAPEQVDDLIAYLEVLGTEADLDPGLSREVIRLGCFLPFSGERQAIGNSVRQALEVLAAEQNERGGVYGRRIEIVYTDAGAGDSGAVTAAQHLISEERVFALIACATPLAAPRLGALLAERRVPLIGPLTIPSRPDVPPNRYVFHLLSSSFDQARVLVEFVATTPELPRVGWSIVTLDDEVHQEARAGALRQIEVFGGSATVDRVYAPGGLDAVAAVVALREAGTRGLMVFGARGDIVAIAEAMESEGIDWPLLTTGQTLGRDAFLLPTAVAGRTFITYPSSQPGPEELTWALELARDRGLQFDRPAQQGPALAALRLFIEGARRSGRRLGRERLIESLETIERFGTGLVPPLTFGLNQRTGALGAYVMQIDLAERTFRPASQWITPRQPR